MNKKVLVGFVAVFFAFTVIDEVLMKFAFVPISHIMRPEAERELWIVLVSYAFFAYFFTWIFSKGYEGKGILEGVRYGFAVAFMMMLPWAYVNYAMIKDFPYLVALQSFLYSTADTVICGIILAWVFGMKPKEQSAA